jgi:hypothetical protein
VVRWYLPAEWRSLIGIGGGRAKRDVLKERAWDLAVSRGFAPRTEDDADAACVALARAVELSGVES